MHLVGSYYEDRLFASSCPSVFLCNHLPVMNNSTPTRRTDMKFHAHTWMTTLVANAATLWRLPSLPCVLKSPRVTWYSGCFRHVCILLSNSLTFQIEPMLMRLLLSIKVTSLMYPIGLYEPRQIQIMHFWQTFSASDRRIWRKWYTPRTEYTAYSLQEFSYCSGQ